MTVWIGVNVWIGCRIFIDLLLQHLSHHLASQEILAAEQRNKVVSKLHAILKPFMLRRLKSDVAIGLPRKVGDS